ncbi:unnamed protein product [Sphacelaria rigidula]
MSVYLVDFEHPSIFLGAAICTVSNFFTNFTFPSHTSPAYSSFGAITCIDIHIFILVSICKSLSPAILPICALTFSAILFMCAS